MATCSIDGLSIVGGHLSERGALSAQPGKKVAWLDVVNGLWDSSSNPNGFVSLGIAENSTIHAGILQYLNTHFTFDHYLLEYRGSLSGSDHLRQALASFLTRHFHAAIPVLPEHVVVTSGVGHGMDSLSFSICEPGDGILLGRPFFRGFPQAMESRAGSKILPVSFDGVDMFSMEAVSKYGEALTAAKARGHTVKALILCNPHNPLGRCYSREVLREYMIFCQVHQLHLISDEIYAFSVWENQLATGAPEFCSVLSVPTDGVIDPGLVHALWGMSKDFGSNGIKLGCIISQGNENLHRCLETNSYFTCPSSLSDRMSALMLSDSNFMDSLINKNKERLTERFTHVTKSLRTFGIPYETRSNAAVYVWADLFSYWKPRMGCKSGALLLPEQLEQTWRLESELNRVFLDYKLFLGTGKSFRHSEAGWFRITFALDFERLDEGMRRLKTALEHFEQKHPTYFRSTKKQT